MTDNESTYAPGSDEAIEHGCTCPRMDNCYGEGWVVDGLRHWWIAQDCPIHGWEEDVDADRKRKTVA